MLSDGLENFLNYIRDCQQEYNMASTEEMETNCQTQDILHSLELDEHDDASLIQLSKALVIVRNSRREYKDRIRILQPIVDWASANKKTLEELRRVLGNVRKEEKRISSQTYIKRTNILDNLSDYISDEEESSLGFFDAGL